ncbi:MAG: 50S ribosomal protein L30 [Desulfovibrionales bacterium]
MLRVTLIKSSIGCTPKQKRTLEALGLKRIRQAKEFQKSKPIEGMLTTVHHLVEVEEKE